jgi:hypothetical protein
MVRAPDLIGDRANSKVDAGWHIARGYACVPETHQPCLRGSPAFVTEAAEDLGFVVGALCRDRPFDAARLGGSATRGGQDALRGGVGCSARGTATRRFRGRR